VRPNIGNNNSMQPTMKIQQHNMINPNPQTIQPNMQLNPSLFAMNQTYKQMTFARNILNNYLMYQNIVTNNNLNNQTSNNLDLNKYKLNISKNIITDIK